MSDTSRYLSILSKVMNNKDVTNEGPDKQKYDELYSLIHSKLNVELQKSMYPNASDIIRKTETMLDAMESLYLCQEIVGKRCISISSHITTNIFDVCQKLFINKKWIQKFQKIYIHGFH